MLITEMLRQECDRTGVAEFSVVQAEQAERCRLAGVPLRVRMDRVDQLDGLAEGVAAEHPSRQKAQVAQAAACLDGDQVQIAVADAGAGRQLPLFRRLG